MFSRDESDVLKLLDGTEPDDSGSVKNIYIGSEEVMKVPKAPSWISSTDSARSKLQSLEDAKISHPETEVREYDLSEIEVRGLSDEDLPEHFSDYREQCPVVFQEKVEVLNEIGQEEFHEITNLIDYAASHGIVFPDNGADNWSYTEEGIYRVDIADDMAVINHGDRMPSEAAKHNLKVCRDTMSDDLAFEPEEYFVDLLRDSSEFYDSAGYVSPSKVS